MSKWVKRVLCALLIIVSIPALFFAASFVGATIPGETKSGSNGNVTKTDSKTILIIMNPLHADFALPVDDALKERLGFLKETQFPFDHSLLRYVAVGWGSRAFYTTAGTYSDIKASAVFKAVTGDVAVLRFEGIGEVAELSNTIRLTLTEIQYERLLLEILSSMKLANEKPQWIAEASISPNDAFFEANGRFNIFNPCNQWANEILRRAGIKLGVWTPTAQSLKYSLATHTEAIFQ